MAVAARKDERDLPDEWLPEVQHFGAENARFWGSRL